MVVVATKADIKNERECESIVIKKWAEAEKGNCFVQVYTCIYGHGSFGNGNGNCIYMEHFPKLKCALQFNSGVRSGVSL